MYELYRHYAADGTLLYVGLTVGGESRQFSHRRDKKWWADVKATTYERDFNSLEELETAERKAIREEKPKHNKLRYNLTPRPSNYGEQQRIKRERWLAERHKEAANIRLEAERRKERLILLYRDFAQDREAVPSGAFAREAYAHEDFSSLTIEKFKQFCLETLGPTVDYHDGVAMRKGWTKDVHAMNLRRAEDLLQKSHD